MYNYYPTPFLFDEQTPSPSTTRTEKEVAVEKNKECKPTIKIVKRKKISICCVCFLVLFQLQYFD